jgi:type II secretory pathway pseudopilin PulG
MRRYLGYSFIELLVTMSIAGVLGLSAMAYKGFQKPDPVLATMAELEALLTKAQQDTFTTGKDVILTPSGEWKAGTLRLEAKPLLPAADQRIRSTFNSQKQTGPDSDGTPSRYPILPKYPGAAVVTEAEWYPLVLGNGMDLKTFGLCRCEPYKTAIETRLLEGTHHHVKIKWQDGTFETGFSILVVDVSDSGEPIKDGSMGMVVVPANRSVVYHFYRPQGEKTWKRV